MYSSRITKTEKETDEKSGVIWQRSTNDWNRANGKGQKLIVTSVDNGALQNLINCTSVLTVRLKCGKNLSVFTFKSPKQVYICFNRSF